ncbi:hypothetical protein FQR65_LT12011 [Abscondita terminalis]|nr:hypothetical protein FQR65_LT12011 [Abscondita terminalis]
MMSRILVFHIVCFFTFCQVWSVEFVDGFFDYADNQCEIDLKIPAVTYKSWFNQDMVIVEENNPQIEEYLRCWLVKRGIANENADLIEDKMLEWLQNDVYTYVKKDDIEKYPMEGRKVLVADIAKECMQKYGVDNNVQGHIVQLYNCIIMGVSKL